MPVYARYSGYNVGTPVMLYDLEMLLTPGTSESTRENVLSKALAYWQHVQATTTDGNLLQRANDAVTWIPLELSRIIAPPLDTSYQALPV